MGLPGEGVVGGQGFNVKLGDDCQLREGEPNPPQPRSTLDTETDHPWAASAVEAAHGLLAADHGELQKLPMGGHLCTGSPCV